MSQLNSNGVLRDRINFEININFYKQFTTDKTNLKTSSWQY